MRIIKKNKIIQTVTDLCIKANLELPSEVKELLKQAHSKEKQNLSKQILQEILVNCQIAKTKQIPICQDTGLAVVFVAKGEEVKIEGNTLEKIIQEGVKQGYKQGFLRKSVVDPLTRINTGNNTPAVIHLNSIKGDKLKITIVPKGFGSENMGKVIMLNPGEGVAGIRKFVMDSVKQAGANPCPPIIVGVGIGGTLEKAALLAKEALFEINISGKKDKKVNELERTLLKEINRLNIGPAGLGGKITALKVNIKTYPTHIAGLPVAVNIGCWCHRQKTAVI